MRACILDFGGSWEDHLHLVEFSYNNIYQECIGIASYEALDGQPCKSLLCWVENKDPLVLGSDVIQKVMKKVYMIMRKMKEAQDRQKSYADRRWRVLEFSVGDFFVCECFPD